MVDECYLKPGEFYLAEESAHITTVLGSCVALTFFDPSSMIGAICHAVHPRCEPLTACAGNCGQQFAFVTCAVPAMLERLHPYDIDWDRMEIKLFGGASILNSRTTQDRHISVGRQNIEAAQAVLKARKLRLKVAEVGGWLGRKLIFDTATGNVWIKRLTGIRNTSNGQGVPPAAPVSPKASFR